MGSLERGLDLLELLNEHGEGRLAELAAALGMSRATAFRLLTTLRARGYVEHDRAARVYRLGLSVGANTFVRHAQATLNDLRTVTEETVSLATLRGARIAYSSVLPSAHALRVSHAVGEGPVPTASAVGKAILAALPMEFRASVAGPSPYPSFTARSITSSRSLQRELEAIAARGYAIEDEEHVVGAAAVAAAILRSDGYPLGAIEISGLAARMSSSTRTSLGKAVAKRAAELTKLIHEWAKGDSDKGDWRRIGVAARKRRAG